AHRKDALLKSLIALHEPPYAQQWMNLDEKFQETMLGAIAAFRMTVTRLEGKFKLNQHRKEAHATMKVGYAAGTPDEQALGHWMERLGL
ncbi:MAG TPA: FMN-binding negative transcriptional regulator, partial [Casimicrobium huifangae]|nr:FMN-binding negative transcriptional regulator [Casimicrobium huifangae]